MKKTIYSFTILLGILVAGIVPVAAEASSATINSIPVSSYDENITIKGTASDARTLLFDIRNQSGTKSFHYSKKVTVRNGIWSTRFTKKIALGSYTVKVSEKRSGKQYTLATTTYTVGDKVVTSVGSGKGVVIAEAVPLLMGGIAKPGQKISLSYIKLINLGTEKTSINSITLEQAGNASTNNIVSINVTDDLGYIKLHGENNIQNLFKGNRAEVPVLIYLMPGEMRMITVTAGLNLNPITAVGSQYQINVSAIGVSGTLRSALPIRGTTWTAVN